MQLQSSLLLNETTFDESFLRTLKFQFWILWTYFFSLGEPVLLLSLTHLTTSMLDFALELASPNFLTSKVDSSWRNFGSSSKFWFSWLHQICLCLDLFRRVYTTLFWVAVSMLYRLYNNQRTWTWVLGFSKRRCVFILLVHNSIWSMDNYINLTHRSKRLF